MNTGSNQEDKEAVNQFLQLGRLIFQIRSRYPSMSETDILQMSRLMTTVASGTLIQAISPQGQKLIEKLSPEPTVRAKAKTGRKIKLSSMSPEERKAKVLGALAGSDGMLAGEIAQRIGLKGAQGISPMLFKLSKEGYIRSKKGKRKGETIWSPVQKAHVNGKSNGHMNGFGLHAAT